MALTLHVPETHGDDDGTIDVKESDQIQRLTESHADSENPTLFKMRVALPEQGRGHSFLAATDRMTAVLKSYASDGENKLHSHINEDHMFIVMQGQGKFSGPDGESVVLKCHEGIMLPRGTLYTFMAEGDEPLVLLRVGCTVDTSKTPWGRVNEHGEPVRGNAKENNTVPTVFLDGQFFE